MHFRVWCLGFCERCNFTGREGRGRGRERELGILVAAVAAMARSCCCSHTQFSVSSSRLFLLSFTASAVFSPAHAHLRYRKSQLVCSSSAIASAAAAAAAKSRVVVAPPPEDYDFRAETRLQTVETVRTHFPQLMDLVEDGTLVVVKRAVDYVERRSDGYVEPEVVFVVGTAHMSRVSALQVSSSWCKIFQSFVLSFCSKQSISYPIIAIPGC